MSGRRVTIEDLCRYTLRSGQIAKSWFMGGDPPMEQVGWWHPGYQMQTEDRWCDECEPLYRLTPAPRC